MADDNAIWLLILKKYGRVYNPEANAAATAEKEERLKRKAALNAKLPAGGRR